MCGGGGGGGGGVEVKILNLNIMLYGFSILWIRNFLFVVGGRGRGEGIYH